MGDYKSDKIFTDFIHNNLAIKYIYEPLNWQLQDMNVLIMDNIDIHNSVDYMAIDKKDFKIITIQERFREKKYSSYTDFTIRYKRDFNRHEERKHSEYFKLNVNYFIYGIISQDKKTINKECQFLKFAVIDIKKLFEMIDEKLIVIDEKSNYKRCIEKAGIMICPVIQNYDNSSSFVPIDIVLLNKIYPNSNIVVFQDGFNK